METQTDIFHCKTGRKRETPEKEEKKKERMKTEQLKMIDTRNGGIRRRERKKQNS